MPITPNDIINNSNTIIHLPYGNPSEYFKQNAIIAGTKNLSIGPQRAPNNGTITLNFGIEFAITTINL